MSALGEGERPLGTAPLPSPPPPTALTFSTAWSKVGEPAVVTAPTPYPRLTVMGAIANRWANAFKRLDGALNGSTFNRWLREDLGPHLRPGDCVVMDNLRAHKVGGVVEALEEVGASPLCLSPYSPELNPIELVWASSNREVRAIAPRVREAQEEIVDGLGATVPTDLCQQWIAHCGHADTQHECGPLYVVGHGANGTDCGPCAENDPETPGLIVFQATARPPARYEGPERASPARASDAPFPTPHRLRGCLGNSQRPGKPIPPAGPFLTGD